MHRSTIRTGALIASLLALTIPANAAPRPKPTPTPTTSTVPTNTPTPPASMTPTRTPTPTPTRTPTATPKPTATPTQSGGLSLAITDPLPGASINGNRYTVIGTFTAPLNTGITVNDRIAYASAGRFVMNDVELIAGTNTITAVATTVGGQSATVSTNVTSSGLPPELVLHADTTRGLAPLSVTFTYDFTPTQPINKVAIDFDGDGRDDFWTRKPVTAMQNTYTMPGLYVALLTVTDTAGVVRKSNIGIEVSTAAARDSLFHSVWDTMNSALVRGDINGALTMLNSRAQEQYASVFNALVSEMPVIVASYSDPQFVSSDADNFEYAINRMIDGEDQIFLVYLVRDGDGVWRMDGM
jgi:Glucodextranase, domain B